MSRMQLFPPMVIPNRSATRPNKFKFFCDSPPLCKYNSNSHPQLPGAKADTWKSAVLLAWLKESGVYDQFNATTLPSTLTSASEALADIQKHQQKALSVLPQLNATLSSAQLLRSPLVLSVLQEAGVGDLMYRVQNITGLPLAGLMASNGGAELTDDRADTGSQKGGMKMAGLAQASKAALTKGVLQSLKSGNFTVDDLLRSLPLDSLHTAGKLLNASLSGVSVEQVVALVKTLRAAEAGKAPAPGRDVKPGVFDQVQPALDQVKPATFNHVKSATFDQVKPPAFDQVKPATFGQVKPAAIDHIKLATFGQDHSSTFPEVKPATFANVKPATFNQVKPAAFDQPKPVIDLVNAAAIDQVSRNQDSSNQDSSDDDFTVKPAIPQLNNQRASASTPAFKASPEEASLEDQQLSAQVRTTAAVVTNITKEAEELKQAKLRVANGAFTTATQQAEMQLTAGVKAANDALLQVGIHVIRVPSVLLAAWGAPFEVK